MDGNEMEGWISAISLTRGRAQKLSFAQLCFFFFKFKFFFFLLLAPVRAGESVEQRDDLLVSTGGGGAWLGSVIQAAPLDRIICSD